MSSSYMFWYQRRCWVWPWLLNIRVREKDCQKRTTGNGVKKSTAFKGAGHYSMQGRYSDSFLSSGNTYLSSIRQRKPKHTSAITNASWCDEEHNEGWTLWINLVEKSSPEHQKPRWSCGLRQVWCSSGHWYGEGIPVLRGAWWNSPCESLSALGQGSHPPRDWDASCDHQRAA